MGVIGADVHAVGNKILYHAFTQAGFEVVNLGVMVSQEEYIAAAIEANADAIVGIRRPDAAMLVTLPVGIMPGRAVTPCATDTMLNAKIKLNVCFKNDDIPNSCFF